MVHLERTKNQILDQEDTDQNSQITVEDSGPKYLQLSTAQSHGLTSRSISGHYMISNLLQELALAQELPDKQIVIEEARLRENPVVRLCKIVSGVFWPNLRRAIDLKGLQTIIKDTKNRGKDQTARIYVPHNDAFAAEYYRRAAEEIKNDFKLDVCVLPEQIDESFVQSINEHPGILSLQLRIRNPLGRWENTTEFSAQAVPKDLTEVRGLPFIVPGGRFNEMYGWDSYFSVLGLLKSVEALQRGQLDNLFMAKSMVDNFVYQLRNYGKILNANRSYYLLRTQPPFLTDMAWQVYLELCKFVADPSKITGAAVEEELLSEAPIEWLRRVCEAAIFEYTTVWMAEPRLVKSTGLSRYFGAGQGLPPETEESHFNAVLKRFAQAAGTDDPHEIARLYNSGRFKSQELGKSFKKEFILYSLRSLDEYFLHDRAVRESGHDTTYRLDGRCAHLCTVDLNSLLYRYERDIARFLELFSLPGECAAEWETRAAARKEAMDKWLWNDEYGQYFDWNFKKEEPVVYDSATAFWPLWAGAASSEQATKLINNLLPKLEMPGGLVSGTEQSRGSISLERPSRQWDFPFGWAPHQIMLWQGLRQYGFEDETRRLAYRWLYTIVKAYSDYNGVVPEKFDVVTGSHRVDVEYGNVGTDFKMVAKEGFAWMNASFMIGMGVLGVKEKRALGALIPSELLYKETKK